MFSAQKTKAMKVACPDGFSTRSANQLYDVVLNILNLSLSQKKVPVHGKSSKASHWRQDNHFRPVSWTSREVKSLKMLVPTHLRIFAPAACMFKGYRQEMLFVMLLSVFHH